MELQKIPERIKEADMVLVGLGEDFNDKKRLRSCPQYLRGRETLKKADCGWLQPAWSGFCSGKVGGDIVRPALEKLAGFLGDRNYFIVSVATDRRITEIPWRQNRLVMPCGAATRKQCAAGCGDVLTDMTEDDRKLLLRAFGELYDNSASEDGLYDGGFSAGMREAFGKCPRCGSPMVFNNIFAKRYNESCYCAEWQIYTKWLQGTLNHSLAVLELGVGMDFPSVIRWPFEKIVYLNQRAVLFRVNEKLYQISKELSGRAFGIPENAIEWLERL